MSKIQEALDFLYEDINKAKLQWSTDSGPAQFKSMLQRESCDLSKLLTTFDPADDETKWAEEYANKARGNFLQLYRKRIAFLKASRKEFHEEYDPGVTDVDFMRLMEVPFTDSKYAIQWSMGEMGD